MQKDFEEFPKPIRNNLKKLFDTMSQLQKDISQLSARLSDSRQAFKESIESCFQQQSPFPTKRGEIEDDIEQYTRLVSYCLDAGDTEILDKWGIQSVLSNPAQMLASNNYELYHLAFNNARERSETSLEEDCWVRVIQMSQQFQNPGGTVVTAQRR